MVGHFFIGQFISLWKLFRDAYGELRARGPEPVASD